ncbi:MAG: C45 family peptidase [Pirellulaceae bacterium]|nr:peptidase C45 [Planctomycetaceae bacterium]
MNSPNRYREINVTGPPHELGRQIGEAASEEIRGFVDIALTQINRTTSVSRSQASRIANQSIDYVADYSPHLLDELRGISDGAGVSLEDVMLLQIRNQFAAELDSGCTSFSVGAKANRTGRMLVGQNWDNDPGLDAYTVVLTRHPEGKPSLMTVTQAGLIAYIGLNDAGIAACLNTLPAPSRPLGVPHYFTLRCLYETNSLDEAVAVVHKAKRAIPANIMLATPDGPADLEITIDKVSLLRDSADCVVTHTNHCLHPDLIAINDQFDELIESKPRKKRIDEMLSDGSCSLDLATLKAALRDHQDYPKSICRHANDHPHNGFWETVFSVILDPEKGEMHVARGTPCDREYEVYALNGSG